MQCILCNAFYASLKLMLTQLSLQAKVDLKLGQSLAIPKIVAFLSLLCCPTQFNIKLRSFIDWMNEEKLLRIKYTLNIGVCCTIHTPVQSVHINCTGVHQPDINS
jgi:hypothetical protein